MNLKQTHCGCSHFLSLVLLLLYSSLASILFQEQEHKHNRLSLATKSNTHTYHNSTVQIFNELWQSPFFIPLGLCNVRPYRRYHTVGDERDKREGREERGFFTFSPHALTVPVIYSKPRGHFSLLEDKTLSTAQELHSCLSEYNIAYPNRFVCKGLLWFVK